MYGEKNLMQKEEYLKVVNKYLEGKYAISLSDTGYSVDEWLSRFGELDVEDAVELYAEKYNLTSWGE